MTNYLYQVQINFKRTILRNKAFFFFDMLLPISFYILYTKILINGGTPSQLQTWNQNYLISMMIYGCVLGSIITTANTLLSDQVTHFKLFIDLSPISTFRYYSSMAIVFITLNLIASITISVVGILINHISLPITILTKLILINSLGTIPLILIGVLVSLAKRPETVNLLTNLIVFPMAIISGLWWPLEIMPKWLQNIGKLMPTYQLSIIDRAVLKNTNVDISALINIFAWFIILALLFLVTNKLQKQKGIVTQ